MVTRKITTIRFVLPRIKKDVIQKQYRDEQKKNDIEAKFYTIGLGINSTGQAALMLDPSLGAGATEASALLEDIQSNPASRMDFLLMNMQMIHGREPSPIVT